jgi:pimeloyl-ACP methyl ester carboxylesterase
VEHGTLDAGGCRIAWCGRGERAEGAVVLVHGARAHRHWWDAAVESGLGRGGRRVVAIDLSGHGDSDRRPEYSPEAWADEVLTAVDECAGGRAAVIGHSMGGLVAVVAAARRPDLVSALVLVDTRIRISAPPDSLEPRGTPAKVLRTFPSREAAIESIRLFPPQPVVDAEVVRHVAERSVGCVDGEWTWKFRAAEAILGRPVPTTVVAGAHHHLILDRPGACAGAIAGALAATSFNLPPA